MYIHAQTCCGHNNKIKYIVSHRALSFFFLHTGCALCDSPKIHTNIHMYVYSPWYTCVCPLYGDMRKRSYICMVYSIFSCCPVSVKFKEIAALSFSKRVSSNISHSALLRRVKRKKRFGYFGILWISVIGGVWEGYWMKFEGLAWVSIATFSIEEILWSEKSKDLLWQWKNRCLFSIPTKRNGEFYINRISIQLYRLNITCTVNCFPNLK